MPPEIILPALLVLQGIVGGVDTLINHEIIERLPHRVEARNEIGLHWVRETIYACLFGGLAWFEFHGAAARSSSRCWSAKSSSPYATNT